MHKNMITVVNYTNCSKITFKLGIGKYLNVYYYLNSKKFTFTKNVSSQS